MFRGCSSLASLDVSGWDTSSVTSMGTMFDGCSGLSSLKVGVDFTLDLSKTSFPFPTLYTADGTAVALADVPKGVAATYYTKLEYVPSQPAGDEPADGQDAAVQGADAVADAANGMAEDATSSDAGSTLGDDAESDGASSADADPTAATQLDAVQDDSTSPLSDT